MSVEVGDVAPEFTLRDQFGKDVALSSFRGERTVLLLFYPLAFTGVCQGELCAVRDDLTELQNDDVQILAVSVDSPPAHKAWAEQQGFDFPLLSDFWPHGAVAKQYGVFNDVAGLALRGSFVIDKQGIVRWKVVNAIPDARDHAQYAKVLASLGS